MASARPNLQNLPRDPAYRRCFVAGRPGRLLVKADYSQIELRIAAKIAGDEKMTQAFREGRDLHSMTARSLTGRSEVSKEERQLGKTANFGLIYGISASALARKAKTDLDIDLTAKQAQRYRDAFFRAWPGIAAWHEQIKREAWQQRWRPSKAGPPEVRTLSGRRVLVDPVKAWYGARANFAVQGSGGDIVKLALALLWERRKKVRGCFPVLAVHDEIAVECASEQADAAAVWLKSAMLDAAQPLLDPVPVEVEVSSAPTWGG
jgi:DNA polymerase-1